MGGLDFRNTVPSFAGFARTFGASATVKEEGKKHNISRFLFYFSSHGMAACVEQRHVPFFSGTVLTFSFTRETFLCETSATAIDTAKKCGSSYIEI